MRLIDVSLDHTDHRPVGLDPHVLLQHPPLAPLGDAPLAPDLEDSEGRVRGDLGVGAVVVVGDLQLVGGAADGLAVGDAVLGRELRVALEELVVLDGGGELDDEGVVVQGRDDGGVRDVGWDGGRDGGLVLLAHDFVGAG